MSTKIWNDAKKEYAAVKCEDAASELVQTDKILAVATAEIKRLVELLREAHKQVAKIHIAAGSSAFSTREFELEKRDCVQCGGSGKSDTDDVCVRCRGSGEEEVVPDE